MSSSLTLLWSDRPPALTFWGPVTGHVAGPQKHLSPTHSMTLRVLQPCSGRVPAGNMEQDPGFHPCPTVHTAGPGWVEPRAGSHPNLEIAGEMGRGRRGSEWAAGGPPLQLKLPVMCCTAGIRYWGRTTASALVRGQCDGRCLSTCSRIPGPQHSLPQNPRV